MRCLRRRSCRGHRGVSFSPSFGRDSTTRWCDEREEGGRHAPCAVNHVDDLGLAIARHLQPSDSRIHARVKDCDADISAIPRGCEMRIRHARQLVQYRTSGPPLKGMNLLSKNPSWVAAAESAFTNFSQYFPPSHRSISPTESSMPFGSAIASTNALQHPTICSFAPGGGSNLRGVGHKAGGEV